jgi:site-specific DNA recombinase
MQASTVIHAAIYARVSSERQSREGTIQSQIAALKTRAKDDGILLEPDNEFIDDGFSGSTLARPSLDRLRDHAAAGKVDRLYVLAPDRLARRYAYQVLLIDELQNCDVEIVFLNRHIGQGPEDDLLLQVQGVVAEYERAKILERSRRGKQHAAKRGSVSVLTKAPYGFRYIARNLAGGDARLNVEFEKARVVRDMFHWVAIERLSLSGVARRLKSQGILSPKGNNYWERGTVYGILRNPCYKGLAAYGKRQTVARQPRLRPLRNKSEQPRRAASWKRMPAEQWITIPVPAIVDPAVFDAVQEQLSENRKLHRRACANARYLLQGLVMCKCCGFAMCGARNGTRMYYRTICKNMPGKLSARSND